MQEHLIRVDREGNLQFIYTDDLAELLEEGQPHVSRASHVEPTEDGQWTADMSPVDGPVLGPFQLRGTALAEEVAWLEQNLFGQEK